jgi:exodeoxyribonuclease V
MKIAGEEVVVSLEARRLGAEKLNAWINDPPPTPVPDITLTEDQLRAKQEMEASIEMRRFHLLTGSAGTGKTTLVQIMAREAYARGLIVRLAAPTHKAAGVLRAKLGLPCGTIHSLLSLRPKADRDRQVFVRSANARPLTGDLFIIDECSMLGEELMRHVRRLLNGHAVILVGDPAQIPPVGEANSESFDTVPASHLTTVVRQAAGNPIIAAAQIIRATQDDPDAPMDWSWCRQERVGDIGVFLPPRGQADAWLKKAIMSDAFKEDPDFARYLCHTNDRVLHVNTRVRTWLFGKDALAAPFLEGEMLLMRSPLVLDDAIAIATNEEVRVLDIDYGSHQNVGTWEIKVRTDMDKVYNIHVPRDWNEYQLALAEMRDACKGGTQEWEALHEFTASFIRAQSIYAMTLHASQGSTFQWAFLDVPNARARMMDNPLEVRRLLYTGATRAAKGLVLVGV